jgi:hypothetical protein
MPIQIIQEHRKPSFGQKLNEGIGRGLEAAQQWADEVKGEKRKKVFADEMKNKFGVDISGMSQEGMEKFATEAYKASEKNKSKKEDLDYISKLFGFDMDQDQENEQIPKETYEYNEKEDVEKPKNALQETNKPDKKNSKINKDDLIPEDKIYAVSLRNPALATQMREHNKSIEENKNRIEQENRKDIREYHKESAEFDDEIYKNYKAAESQLSAVDDSMKALKSGKISPKSAANVFSFFGETGRKIRDALLSGEEATLLASIPAFLEGRKELFGVRLSDADLKLLQDKMPDISKSPEANKAIMRLMKKYGELAQLRYKIGAQIKKENKNLRPLGYRDRIEEDYKNMTKSVKIIPPGEAEEIEIPAYKLTAALKKGARLVE